MNSNNAHSSNSKESFQGNSTEESIFTTRLQKGGALLEEVRSIVSVWSENSKDQNVTKVLSNLLTKTTSARVKDIYTRTFRPRFLEGSPPNAWKLARVLEDLHADIQIIRPFYYWITARAEPPLYNFVTDVVYSRVRTSDRDIRIDEVVSWLDRQLKNRGKSWTPTVQRKVSRGLLATLRDFGILEGSTRKRVAAVNLPPEACVLIAFCLHDLGVSGRELIQHPDWRLFLLGETGVEHLFMECHQHGWLRFETAGNIYRTEFPVQSFEEFAHVVIGRSV